MDGVKKNRILGWLVLLGTILVLFLFLEVGLRFIGKTSDNFLRQDPVLGWIHQANKSGRSVTKEYNVRVRLNEHGLVGPRTSVEKPEGIYRIAIIGDSVVEAFQVEERDSFIRLLEKNLNQAVPALSKVEALNFGVTSYGTVKEYYVFENQVLPFKPDLVLLGLFTGNDFSDNLSEEINLLAKFGFYKKFSNSAKLFLRNHSTAYRFFLEKKARNRVLRSLQGSPLQACKGDPCREESEVSNDTLNKTETYLTKFKKLADERGIKLLVLILPSKTQVNGPANSNFALSSFLSRENISHLDVLPPFQSWAKMNPGASVFFPVDGHPSEDGHKIIADALVSFLKSYGKIFDF